MTAIFTAMALLSRSLTFRSSSGNLINSVRFLGALAVNSSVTFTNRMASDGVTVSRISTEAAVADPANNPPGKAMTEWIMRFRSKSARSSRSAPALKSALLGTTAMILPMVCARRWRRFNTMLDCVFSGNRSCGSYSTSLVAYRRPCSRMHTLTGKVLSRPCSVNVGINTGSFR
ncbi:hypothetical protein D3C81_1193620 [compost metagenome]